MESYGETGSRSTSTSPGPDPRSTGRRASWEGPGLRRQHSRRSANPNPMAAGWSQDSLTTTTAPHAPQSGARMQRMDSTQSKARANNRRRGSVVESVSSSLGLRPVVSVANIFTSIPYGELELKCGVLEKMTHAAGAAEWVHGHTVCAGISQTPIWLHVALIGPAQQLLTPLVRICDRPHMAPAQRCPYRARPLSNA